LREIFVWEEIRSIEVETRISLRQWHLIHYRADVAVLVHDPHANS